MTKLIKPSGLRAEAERLITAGEMPTLEELLDVVAEVRQAYKPKIEANRRAGEYPLLDEMNRLGIPLTRENYIALDQWKHQGSHGIVDPEVDGEFESTLPPQFRR